MEMDVISRLGEVTFVNEKLSFGKALSLTSMAVEPDEITKAAEMHKEAIKISVNGSGELNNGI